MFMMPAKGTTITNPFQILGRNKHFGVDFAKAGTIQIVASADGTVSKSYYSSSYGECIMILHYLNGQVFETVYAHLRKDSRKVTTGQKVKQGQVIGIMGSTGDSTGQHLHFELHRGRWNGTKSNAVNPMNYFHIKTPQTSSSPNSTIYTVKKGDTLTKISQQYKTTVAKIVSANKLKNSNLITIGQKLKIPSSFSYHVVKKGDTVSAIAKKYNSSEAVIKQWNQLKDINKIFPGQRLRVK
ncbi:MAG: LysM peptidoglycan-binding domain-containing protein [Bacillus sp. (in: firmicutes)]